MKSRLHALIIGINQYTGKGTTKLKGAVADADRVQTFLQEELGARLSLIRNLRDEQATRAIILEELQSLSCNEDIKHDDPILVYFAGHGTQAPAPPSWHSEDAQIQMLIPYDYGFPTNNGEEIEGIPDRTLASILTEIANTKGDNITVILDCCHSGSGTRSGPAEVLTRGIDHRSKAVSEVLDQRIWSKERRSRGATVSKTHQYHGLGSHVLLAACTSEERAQEISGRGVFTNALLSTLSGLNIDKLSYVDLIQRMDALPQQNPQCEGRNQNRMIFNSKVRNIKAYYKVQQIKGQLVISAGTAHGVEVGTKFELWENQDSIQDQESLVTVTITKAAAFESTTPLPEMTYKRRAAPSVAIQVGPATKPTLRLHIPHAMADSEVIQRALQNEGTLPNSRMAILACEKDKADVGLIDHDGRIAFEVLNHQETYLLSGSNLIQCEIDYNVDELRQVLSCMAHYEHHLRRTNAKPPRIDSSSFRLMFNIDVYRIEADHNNVYLPVGSTLNISGVGVDLSVNPDAAMFYGFKITNNSEFDVYPALFYFNSWEFSIQRLYLPGSAVKGKVDPPLKANQSLTIGYGSGGVAPQTMGVGSQSGFEVGFLKLFITTQYVDFSNIEQLPIVNSYRAMKPATPSKIALWDTVLVPFNLRQRASARPTSMIALMGYSGTGKASFLDDILAEAGVSEPAFENKYIKEYDIKLVDGSQISLVDLPGFESFDDLSRNLDVLKAIVGYLGLQYQQHRQFRGFVYTHNIARVRVRSLDRLNMTFARKLCGSGAMKVAAVVTTSWDSSNSFESFVNREHSLQSNDAYFKGFKEGGASFHRFGKFSQSNGPTGTTPCSATSIISGLAERLVDLPLAVQIEANEAKNVAGTAVGAELCTKIEQLIQHKKDELQELQDEIHCAPPEELKEIQEEQFALRRDIMIWQKHLDDCGTVQRL